MQKAQNEGIPFASILKLATKAFVENQLNVGLVGKEEFNLRTRKMIARELKDIEKGKTCLRDSVMRRTLSLISRSCNSWKLSIRSVFKRISKDSIKD